jgi:hypothetical protein
MINWDACCVVWLVCVTMGKCTCRCNGFHTVHAHNNRRNRHVLCCAVWLAVVHVLWTTYQGCQATAVACLLVVDWHSTPCCMVQPACLLMLDCLGWCRFATWHATAAAVPNSSLGLWQYQRCSAGPRTACFAECSGGCRCAGHLHLVAYMSFPC